MLMSCAGVQSILFGSPKRSVIPSGTATTMGGAVESRESPRQADDHRGRCHPIGDTLHSARRLAAVGMTAGLKTAATSPERGGNPRPLQLAQNTNINLQVRVSRINTFVVAPNTLGKSDRYTLPYQ